MNGRFGFQEGAYQRETDHDDEVQRALNWAMLLVDEYYGGRDEADKSPDRLERAEEALLTAYKNRNAHEETIDDRDNAEMGLK
jgi:hypothetical protein